VGNLADRIRPLRRLVGPIEAAEIRRFGRSGLSVLFRTPVLVLETTGRRSGATRSTPLAVHRCADGSLLVVGGAGGQTTTADWVLNLRADPDAVAVVDRQRRPVRAIELAGAERERTWAELLEVWPRIATYERRAGRPVPVIRLEPRPG
jgi:deazaflavin-dependent oxidoreductase (nitroreductase family)